MEKCRGKSYFEKSNVIGGENYGKVTRKLSYKDELTVRYSVGVLKFSMKNQKMKITGVGVKNSGGKIQNMEKSGGG